MGRCADTVLAHLHPLCIFVYADRPSKLKRCQKRAAEHENFTPAEMERRMRQIDKNRAKKHELTASIPWGAKEGYDLCVNTSGKEIKTLIPALAAYCQTFSKDSIHQG
ncbi:cytidylate kinase family protein [Oscillospiraceae bacterium 50-60]